MCINMKGPGYCDCFDAATVATQFERDIRSIFLSTQAFVAPSDPVYCEIANERICQFSESNHFCCCQAETEHYRKCLVETVLPPELPPPVAYETTTCQHVCIAVQEEGNSKVVTIGAATGAVTVLVAVFILIFFPRRRRATRNEDGERNLTSPIVNKTIPKSSFWKRNNEAQKPRCETIDGNILDVESSGPISTSSEEESALARSIVARQIYIHNVAPSKAFLKEEQSCIKLNSSEDFVEYGDTYSKVHKVRKKRAIEDWNKYRKEGSNRSLQSYLSTEASEIELITGKDNNYLANRTREGSRVRRKETHTHRESYADRHPQSSSCHHLQMEDNSLEKEEIGNQGRKKNRHASADSPRRSSSFNLLQIEEQKESRKERLQTSVATPRRSTSCHLIHIEDC